MNPTLGSLFDGIAGFPYAASLEGITPVWASEIEPFPMSVSARHFPNMKQLGDVTKINGAEIEPVDIITFGSPCQDHSVAGRRAGFDGARSGLFMEAIRIIDEMRAATNGLYPGFALWENVPGAFSSNGGRDFRAAVGALIGCEVPMPASGGWATAGMVRGYGRSLAWRCFDAQHWGVPQRRRRIFALADFRGQRAPEILFERESVSGHPAEGGGEREGVAAGAEGGVGSAIAVRTAQTSSNGWGIDEKVAYTLDLASGQASCSPVAFGPAGGGKGPLVSVEKSLTLAMGNDQTIFSPLPILEAGARTGASTTDPRAGIGIGEPGDPMYSLQAGKQHNELDMVVCVTGDKTCGSEDGAGRGQPIVAFDHSRCPEPSINVSPTLRACNNPNSAPNGSNSPAIAQCVTTGTGRRYDQETETLIASVDCRNLYENDNLSGTLQSKPGGGYSLNYQNPVRVGYRVRRLTPLECERLMGLPDNYTAGGSDTARYKAIGNGIAIPPVRWIMRQIRRAIEDDE